MGLLGGALVSNRSLFPERCKSRLLKEGQMLVINRVEMGRSIRETHWGGGETSENVKGGWKDKYHYQGSTTSQMGLIRAEY